MPGISRPTFLCGHPLKWSDSLCEIEVDRPGDRCDIHSDTSLSEQRDAYIRDRMNARAMQEGPLLPEHCCGVPEPTDANPDAICQGPKEVNGVCKRHFKAMRVGRLERTLGPDFSVRLRDEMIRSSDSGLVLFDIAIQEQIELLDEGMSAQWLAELRRNVERAKDAINDESLPKAKLWVGKIDEAVTRGADRIKAQDAILAKTRSREELALKIQENTAKLESRVTETKIVELFGMFLKVVAEISGRDHAVLVQERISILFGGGVQPGVNSSSPATFPYLGAGTGVVEVSG